MITWIFILLMLIFCVTDLKYLHISNWLVLPGIALGIYLTRNWQPALVMFGLGAFFFEKNRFSGGDVKLLSMTGAFIGWLALPAFLISKAFIFYYRTRNNERGAIPYAPFLFVGCLPFLFVI